MSQAVNDSGLPLCFVLMPFGRKPTGGGYYVDFDAVYRKIIGPAVEIADLDPIRADEERVGGIIHKPMFERLLLCPYAVADLTLANANVFYELGVRHAFRPYSTILVYAPSSQQLPFDVAPLRAIPYSISRDGTPEGVDNIIEKIRGRLVEARDPMPDSPIYQLLEEFDPPDLSRLKTDVFRDRARYAEAVKHRLAAARKEGIAAVKGVQDELEPIADAEAGSLVDLMLSYRAVSGWDEVISLVEEMPAPIRGSALVQEQLGFSLNRAGRSGEAEEVLLRAIKRNGPSSERLGLLGRVYKDRWQSELNHGRRDVAAVWLDKAISTYRWGFESDWRDAFPGINVATLMEVRDPPDDDRLELLPIIRYAVCRRMASGQPDYWDFATALELAVLEENLDAARNALVRALAAAREQWERETTARNLALIRRAREARGESANWIGELESRLAKG